MNDGCDVAPDDDESREPDAEPATLAGRLVDVVQAGMIVALAALIVAALGVVMQSSPPEEFGSIRSSDEQRLSDARAGLPFGAVLPLRAALRDSADPTTTGAIGPPAPTPTIAITSLPRRIVITRKIRPSGTATATIARRHQAHVTRQARSENPLTIVGRTANVMASTFARDLRALPAQISAIFARNRSRGASRGSGPDF